MSDQHDEQPQREMPPRQLGTYLHFAQFRDASKDEVPVRTRPATGRHPDSGWVETIFDETEWLARPDLWAVELFSRTKGVLAEYYSVHWLADHGLPCSVCKSLVLLLWPETGFDETVLDTLDWMNPPVEPREKNSELAQRVGCLCGSRSVTRECRSYLRGMITSAEFFNKTADLVFSTGWRWPRADLTPEQHRELQEWRQQAWDYGRALALDLCGPNPFRPVVFDPRWRSESAVALARTAYDTRDFALLPILADALEEAGCDHPEVLKHCRDPQQVHVRGCWVVDGVLGQQ